ncbi:MAG: MoxR family ATPase [Gammaproteobacteria bacterium]|nr:MAG: MoxR family ATPase [Gammaproteobacteria bacterium]
MTENQQDIEQQVSDETAEEAVGETVNETESEEKCINTEVERVHRKICDLKEQIGKVLIGQEDILEQVLVSLFTEGHILIEGVPGLGKTLMVRALAASFNGKFGRIQFTPDLMPADVTGHALYDLKSEQFKIRKGPVFTNLLLADEINRAPAKTQAALLEVMQERQVTIEGNSFNIKAPFMVLATQNPIEQEGTYPLPEAQLDRFLMKIVIDFPTEAEEVEMVRLVTDNSLGSTLDVSKVEQIITPEEILAIQKLIAVQTIDSRILDYVVKIVRKTREWGGITYGAGPRGTISLIRAARASALLAGRDFVIPADVKNMALPVLRHRIRLSAEYEIEGYGVDSVLSGLIESVPAPRM